MVEFVYENNDIVNTTISYCVEPNCNTEPGEMEDLQYYNFASNETDIVKGRVMSHKLWLYEAP